MIYIYIYIYTYTHLCIYTYATYTYIPSQVVHNGVEPRFVMNLWMPLAQRRERVRSIR